MNLDEEINLKVREFDSKMLVTTSTFKYELNKLLFHFGVDDTDDNILTKYSTAIYVTTEHRINAYCKLVKNEINRKKSDRRKNIVKIL